MAGALVYALDGGPRTKRDRYQQIRDSLWSERSSFDSHWKELSDWIFPRRTRWFAGDRNRGDKRNQNIIDSTARFAARTLQSGLHAGLTSPARPWFNLTTPDKQLAENKAVKEWLHVVTQRMQVVFADTNLYNALPIVYGDMGVFGTAAVGVLEDSKDLFRCFNYPIGSYALGMDSRGIVNTFTRDYELSVFQVVETFGVRSGYRDIDWSGISTTVKTLWDRGQYTAPVEVCWYVGPNLYADENRLEARYLPWTSCHFEKGEGRDEHFLRESGFNEFPVLAPRWDITGEDTYGTDCPGMTALGDVRQLQSMQKEKAKAIAKMVNPPLKGNPELRTQKTSLLPGDITYLRDADKGLSPVHEVNLNIEHLVLDVDRTAYRIQRAFYEDLFLMLATSDPQRGQQPITAREVEERHEEKLLALGPVLDRTNDELLDRLVDRVYNLMDRNGLIPDPPPELDGVQLKVEYISILAQAQKMVGVVAQDRFVASVAPIIQADPSLRHKIDGNQLIDNYADMLGVDPRIVRSEEEARELQEAEQQQAAAMAEAESAAKMAAATKAASETQLGGNSMLDRMVQGATVQ